MAKFTVDTHLFRELGELLVGRDSTALVELIKNSYDADATEVTVAGHNLDDPHRGKITISDNGIGMTRNHFELGFLRIASRLKEHGKRLSPIYQRRYTGAKGIGRLSAHKLARLIHIYSIPSKSISEEDTRHSVDVFIDWDQIESQQTLDDIENTDAITLRTETVSEKLPSGTSIELRKLRRKWTPTGRARFLAEVHTFSPPSVLIEPPIASANGDLLFDKPTIRTSKSSDPGIDVSLTGDFESGEDYWETLANAAQWVIEVDAHRSDRRVKFNILPTKKGVREFPEARRRTFKMDHPNTELGPFFHARVLVREGPVGSREEKAWLGRSSGIRVYMEGFRVLPYGEPNDDWLSIDSDYTRRQKTLPFLLDSQFSEEAVDPEEGLVALRNSSYFGGVFLTAPESKGLRMLVNREGFVPEESYSDLVRILRTAVDLSVRVRAAAKQSQREERSEKRRSGVDVSPSRVSLQREVESSVSKASEMAREARRLAAAGDFDGAKNRIEQAAAAFSEGSGTAQRLMTEGTILRILASVGMQMSAFVHEINSLLGSLTAVEESVARLQEDEEIPSSARKQIAKLHLALGDLRRNVERHASYLSDVVTPDARRRRARLRFAERFDAARRIVEPLAQKWGIDIVNDIPPDLKSPPIFQAELTTIFSNLLTNAVKAARKNGRIRAYARVNNEVVILRIENTGTAVDLSKGERWFRPFETTTTEVDPVLGQGMGMGLPITRNMLEQYGAEIHFSAPKQGYATALELVFPL